LAIESTQTATVDLVAHTATFSTVGQKSTSAAECRA
jgi:hypothetical protein